MVNKFSFKIILSEEINTTSYSTFYYIFNHKTIHKIQLNFYSKLNHKLKKGNIILYFTQSEIKVKNK